MSVKVQYVDKPRFVKHPQDGSETEMIPLTFVEVSNRPGGNTDLSNSSAALDRILGKQTGLPSFRTHTQLVTPEAADEFVARGTIDELHINRTLSSFPAMEQQKDVKPRMVDNKPTFFQTTLEEVAKPDKDDRLDNNVLAGIAPQYFLEAQLGATVVTTTDAQGNKNGDNRAWLARNKSAIGQNPSSTVESSNVGTGNRGTTGAREGAQKTT